MRLQSTRRRFVVDDTQWALVARVARYWTLSLTVVGSLTVLGWIFISPGAGQLIRAGEQLPSIFGMLMVALAASLLVLPVIVFDLAKFTNRFIGPIVRLRRLMRQVANGHPVDPISFRDGDYWQEFADSFNGILQRLAIAEAAAAAEERFAETPDPTPSKPADELLEEAMA